jgi:hypothetical protein
MAAGSVISLVAAEIDFRYVKVSGIGAAGLFGFPLLIFWTLCIIAAIIVIATNFSFLGILNTLVIFLPGIYLGSAAVWMAWLLWNMRRYP